MNDPYLSGTSTPTGSVSGVPGFSYPPGAGYDQRQGTPQGHVGYDGYATGGHHSSAGYGQDDPLFGALPGNGGHQGGYAAGSPAGAAPGAASGAYDAAPWAAATGGYAANETYGGGQGTYGAYSAYGAYSTYGGYANGSYDDTGFQDTGLYSGLYRTGSYDPGAFGGAEHTGVHPTSGFGVGATSSARGSSGYHPATGTTGVHGIPGQSDTEVTGQWSAAPAWGSSGQWENAAWDTTGQWGVATQWDGTSQYDFTALYAQPDQGSGGTYAGYDRTGVDTGQTQFWDTSMYATLDESQHEPPRPEQRRPEQPRYEQPHHEQSAPPHQIQQTHQTQPHLARSVLDALADESYLTEPVAPGSATYRGHDEHHGHGHVDGAHAYDAGDPYDTHGPYDTQEAYDARGAEGYDGHHHDDGYEDGYEDHGYDEAYPEDLDDDRADASHGAEGPDAPFEVRPYIAPVTPATVRVGAGRGRSRGPGRGPARPRRSALLTVAVPSVAALGVTAVAAASVSGVGEHHDSDALSARAIRANSQLDTQLTEVRADAHDFAGRATRTQQRVELQQRQAAAKKKKEEEAARKEALRPKYVLPVTQHGLSAYFGQAGANWMSVHTGIDFPVMTGTPVRAVTDGTVQTKWNPSYGNMAIVTAPDGTQTWYCHLSSTKIRSGSVKAGTVIAYSGNTGNTTGPHLHFEVRPNGANGGQPIDPLPWLRSHGLNPE